MCTIDKLKDKATKSEFDKKGVFCHTTFASVCKTSPVYRGVYQDYPEEHV